MVEVLPPQQWALQQFAQAKLGDQRRTRRAVAYAAAAAGSPSQSVPQQCSGQWHQTKGVYRLFDQPSVSLDRLQEPHRQLTRQAAATRAVVLWISDTSTLSFNHPGRQGLGPTSDGGQGMLLHSTLAVDVSDGAESVPQVLGLGHQQVGSRSSAKRLKPESRKWKNALLELGACEHEARWVHVADAESDCWEAIAACPEGGLSYVVRACQDRQILCGHNAAAQPANLLQWMREQPSLGKKKLWSRSRPQREAGWLTLSISAAPVTLLAPKNWPEKTHRKNQPRPEPIRCWALRVCQVDAPAGQEPIEWILLTDQCVEDPSWAWTVVFWYCCRWLIEEYHKCLKSGCRVEARQLETAERLQALLGILSVVAVRLLQLKHQAKVNPTLGANAVVPDHYVRTLAAHLKRSEKKMKVREFWIEVARLGGFLARRGDGDPGWLTLWRGWQHLELLTEGYQLAEKSRRRSG